MKATNHVLGGLGTTIFTVMSALAQEHQAVNLGQGFPDEDGPEDVRAGAARALVDGPNQYPPMMGVPALRQAVAAHDRHFYGLDLDWTREVLVTSGATEALTAALLAFLEPGDEVVLFEPLYDSYLPIVRLAGAVPKLVRLSPPDWALPESEVARAFSPRTKLVLLNTPMNPVGKVFSGAEIALVVDLAARFDAVILSDEVYEHLVFDGRPHVSPLQHPKGRDRTLKVGSAGKTFSLTGWKVGYLSGPAPLIAAVAKAHQYLTFTTPPNLQAGVAVGLAKDDTYFTGLAAAMQAKRDRLAQGLVDLGFDVLRAEGTYFLAAGFRRFDGAADDATFARRLTVEAGVAVVPVSAFYDRDPPTDLVRFCFCKRDEVLDEALARLARWAARPSPGA
jgi:aspartate/methionine/tyrosine aminotransferase